MTFGWRKRARVTQGASTVGETPISTEDKGLREFAYLDEVSVQSLLVSLIGELPSEVTSLSARSSENEMSATAGASAPLVAKAEMTARFKGGYSSSSQVLSRAVAESLFKNLRELTSSRLVWSAGSDANEPRDLDRGSLIEIEVDLSPDPVYGFNSAMNVFSDLAADYPTLLDDPTVAMLNAEMGPMNKVLERMLVGLIPLKAEAIGLRAGLVGNERVAGTAAYFDRHGVESEPLFVVGVTEQEKYWRDVRRVLFSRSRFTILGRISRGGLQPKWVPVKLTEVMRALDPSFPDRITRVGRVGYATPVNTREEAGKAALQAALTYYAGRIGGEAAEARSADVAARAASLRDLAASLESQRRAFAAMGDWLVESAIIEQLPANDREARASARAAAGLKGSFAAKSLSDFASAESPEADAPEMLLDLEVIAIYW